MTKLSASLCILFCLLVAFASVAVSSRSEEHRRHERHHDLRHLHAQGLKSIRRRIRVRVRTACQGQSVHLNCHGSYSIRVLDAFYGRANSQICRKLTFKHGHRQKDSHVTRCWARNSRAKARKHCQGKRHCRLAANSRVFGRPCSPETRAYLRVRYTCVFTKCRKVVWLQAKLLKLISSYGRLAKHSYVYWRRRHFRHRCNRLKRKLNKLRRRFHFCFKCRRGCGKLRKLESRLERAEARLRTLLAKISAKQRLNAKKGHDDHQSSRRLRALRVFLRRKLGYLHSRKHLLRRKLRRCMRVCHY